jgi:hypothetical protein
VRTRRSVTVHDILLFSIFPATLHICEPLHVQIEDAPGQAEKNRGMAPHILNLGARWLAVDFIPLPLISGCATEPVWTIIRTEETSWHLPRFEHPAPSC